MARFHRNRQPEEDTRPVATDDFIYDETDSAGDTVLSETPEEAVRKLRGRSVRSAEEESDKSPEEKAVEKELNRVVPNKRKVYSSGIVLDDQLQPVRTLSEFLTALGL